MIRVLHVLGTFNARGAESFVMNVYRDIDRSIVQFDFVKHTEDHNFFDNEAIALGARIYSCPKYNGKNHHEYVNWWNSFFKNHDEYKVIHGHVRSTASIYLKIAKEYGLVTIAHSHSTSNGSGFSAIIKIIMQKKVRYIADFLFSCSDIAGKWLFGSFIKNDNYKMIPNCINIDRFRYNSKIRDFVRQEYNIKTNDFVIGHIGRYSEAKNYTKILSVFEKLCEFVESAKLLLVGLEVEQGVKSFYNKKEILDRVIFAGFQSEPEKFYQAMDIFLFPSKWEGLPVSVVEAQASGLPCLISSNITKDVILTDLVCQEDINACDSVWVEKINFLRKERGDLNGKQRHELSSFDSKIVARDLAIFYISCTK